MQDFEKELNKILNDYSRNIDKNIDKIVNKNAEELKTNHKQSAPKLSGTLSNSFIVEKKAEAEYYIHAGEYNFRAHFVEFGTRYARPNKFMLPLFNTQVVKLQNDLIKYFEGKK